MYYDSDDDQIKTCDGTSWQASAGTPSGAVMFFNLAACPSGWTELISARGRYVVGRPAGGTLAGTVGTALANLENRPVGQHSHPIADPGHTHAHYTSTPFGGPQYVFQMSSDGTSDGGFTYSESSQTGVTISSAGERKRNKRPLYSTFGVPKELMAFNCS